SQLWSTSEARAGNVRQAVALAAALAENHPGHCPLAPRAPWRWLAPRLLPGGAQAFGGDFARLLAEPPGLAVGCGRQAALATRLLRARGSKVVQVLDPRLDPALWDVVVAPLHDGLAGANVITTLGSLHPVDDAWLADARTRFAALEALPRPRTALLLGGDSAHARFDCAAFDALAAMLDGALARDGGSVLATASRRTPARRGRRSPRRRRRRCARAPAARPRARRRGAAGPRRARAPRAARRRGGGRGGARRRPGRGRGWPRRSTGGRGAMAGARP